MKRILMAICWAIITCLPSYAHAASTPIRVVATFSILGDMARQIGGDSAVIKTLVGPDGDAHTYKPTPHDSLALASADLVIVNGFGMEGWIDRLVSASGFKGRVVIVSEGVSPRQIDEEDGADGSHGHHHGNIHGGKAIDPHAWQDISNARIYARNIAAALVKVRPSDSATIMARAASYDAELEALDRWVKAEIGSIAPQKRKIITSHDAFGYFGASYGVSFLSPQGLSTEVEPTATEAAKLIEQMKTEKIKRVFFESMASPKLVKQLAKDAGASVGEPVYSDALSKESGPAATYVAMIRHNVTLFKAAMALNGQ
ncbi:MAG: zinc ABC transporter substrate-binding protein [Bdellovibrionales bacterium]